MSKYVISITDPEKVSEIGPDTYQGAMNLGRGGALSGVNGTRGGTSSGVPPTSWPGISLKFEAAAAEAGLSKSPCALE